MIAKCGLDRLNQSSQRSRSAFRASDAGWARPQTHARKDLNEPLGPAVGLWPVGPGKMPDPRRSCGRKAVVVIWRVTPHTAAQARRVSNPNMGEQPTPRLPARAEPGQPLPPAAKGTRWHRPHRRPSVPQSGRRRSAPSLERQDVPPVAGPLAGIWQAQPCPTSGDHLPKISRPAGTQASTGPVNPGAMAGPTRHATTRPLRPPFCKAVAIAAHPPHLHPPRHAKNQPQGPTSRHPPSRPAPRAARSFRPHARSGPHPASAAPA